MFELIEAANERSVIIGIVMCLIASTYLIIHAYDTFIRKKISDRLYRYIKRQKKGIDRLLVEIRERDAEIDRLNAEIEMLETTCRKLERDKKQLCKWDEKRRNEKCSNARTAD